MGDIEKMNADDLTKVAWAERELAHLTKVAWAVVQARVGTEKISAEEALYVINKAIDKLRVVLDSAVPSEP